MASGTRRLARGCEMAFLVSATFPIVASVLATNDKPLWLGIADVAVAALLVGIAFAVNARFSRDVTDVDRVAAFRGSQITALVIPVLLVVFFLAGNRVDWTVLVIGLAWRGWLLLIVLPSLAAARRLSRRQPL